MAAPHRWLVFHHSVAREVSLIDLALRGEATFAAQGVQRQHSFPVAPDALDGLFVMVE